MRGFYSLAQQEESKISLRGVGGAEGVYKLAQGLWNLETKTPN